MKHCKKCGAQLADDDTYCYFCGANLEEEQKEEPVFRNHDEDSYVPRSTEFNTIALVGFIFAFVSPIIGLVLSIIGLKKARELNGLGRGYAIGGIIVAILNFVITALIYMFLIRNFYGEA